MAPGADLTVPANGQAPPRTEFTEDSDNFDDFAAARGAGEFPDFDDEDDDANDEDDDLAVRLGWTGDKPQERKSFNKYYLFAGAGVVVILVVVAVIMVLQADPPELTTTPRTPPATAAAPGPAQSAARIDLKEPTVHGNTVELNWTSTPETLDFTIVIMRAREELPPIVVGRAHSRTVPIDATSPYCFQIEGTNGDPTAKPFWSEIRSLRGSDCLH